MTIAITFNSNAITGAATWGDTLPKRLLEITIPCRDGAVVGSGYQDTRVISIKGKIIAASDTALRTALNSLSANLSGGQGILALHDDRYINATCKSLDHDFLRGKQGKGVEYQVQFAAHDPYFYANSATTTTTNASSIVTGFTQTLTPVAGSVNTYPVFTVTVSTANLTLLKIENQNATINKFIQLSGTVTVGSVIVIDCKNKTVTINGTDAMYLCTGDFFALAGNGASNVIAFTGTGTSSNVAVSTVYSSRWI